MGTRVPVQQQYSLRSSSSANPYIDSSSLHDLNTVDARTGEIQGITDDADDQNDNDHHSNSVDCIHNSFANSLPIVSVGVEEDRTGLENSGTSRQPYYILTIDDILPIETARARFLQIIVDHFIDKHVIELTDSEIDFSGQCAQDKLNKRKSREVQYEGDPRFVLPLMYVANLYETLVNDVNMKLATLDGIREKTFGVALEAAGGLYRRLAKKFPRKGPCSFKRRELATSLETRTRFPELVMQDQKRVRFVVVNGLVIVERPNNLTVEDAEWFKRLTGRNEVAVSIRDYKFYSPRHKYRRVASHSLPNISGLLPQTEQPASKHHNQPLSHQPLFHPLNQIHQQSMQDSQQAAQYPHAHQCTPSHSPEMPHSHRMPMTQQMACMQPFQGGQVAGRLHPTSPAKFCDECGAPYLRETSKFCSECGFKRLGT